jgi:outer membrane protein assembly factor BamD
MEIAYAYYKSGDQAQALAAVERFIKLHPNRQCDYMYYLRA